MKLSDIVNRINGNVDRFTTDLEYYIGGEHIESNELEITKGGNLKENLGKLGFKFHFAFQERDVIFMARNPHLRKAGMVMFSGLCSDASYILRSKDENVITQEFLAIQLQSDHFWDYCERTKVGSVNFANNWTSIANYEFDLPPIEKQKDIAQKVWAAYRLKESYKKLLTATQEMVKSQFIEMFGVPENNHKKYPIIKIEEIVDSINYGTSKPATDCGEYIYLRMNNITYDGKLDLSDTKRINISPEKNESVFVRKGDLIFNRTNTKEFVGKTTVFNLDEPMVIAGYIIRVVLKKEFTAEFVSGYLNSNYGKALLRKMAKGAVHQANINAQEFQGIQILKVPKMEQEEYVKILNQSEYVESELRKSIEAIDQVIKSLINS